jgi:short-subunit dehydrogenase
LLELNFLAAVRCTQQALPHLLPSRGHLVFIGSLASKVASSYLGAYPASKFPLGAYAQQLRMELGANGLHTLLVCPGPIRRDDQGVRYDSQTEGLPESARRPGGGVRLKGIDPRQLAQRIAKACERRQAELVMPSSARWLAAISQLWPTLGDRIIRRMTR